jgi:hypothetical protein
MIDVIGPGSRSRGVKAALSSLIVIGVVVSETRRA